MLKCLGLCLESLSEIGMHINKPVEGYHERFRAVFIARWPRWPVLCVFVTSTIADIATMAAKAATSSHISFHHNFIIIYEYICTIIYIYAHTISPMAVSLFTSKARRPSRDFRPRPHCTSP